MPLETTKFDVQDHLKTIEEQVAYIEAALEAGDADAIATALGDIARARGVSTFAKESGLSRETIYKRFRPEGNPTLETITKATGALGLRLAVKRVA
jgi:probable addiction module antidote protein